MNIIERTFRNLWQKFWWHYGCRLPFQLTIPCSDGIGSYGVWVNLPKYYVYFGISTMKLPGETRTHFTLQSRENGMIVRGW